MFYLYSLFRFGEIKMKFNRIILEINDECNLKCDWCIRKNIKSNNEILNINKLEYILNKIYSNLNFFELPLVFSLFRFDEPLIKIDNLNLISYTIKKFFKTRGIKTFIYIHTNGLLLNEDSLLSLKYIDMIKVNDYNNKGIINILDRINKIKNIKIVKLIKNLNERDELECILNNKKIVFYINSKSNLHIMSKGSYIKNIKYLRKTECDLIGKILVIDINGDIMACCETYNKIHKDFIIGNIYNDELENLINKYKTINTLSHSYCINCEMSTKFCDISHKSEAICYGN